MSKADEKRLKKVLKYYKGISLSDADVMKLVNGKAKVLVYSDLANYKTLDDAMGPHGALFLLYESQPDYGHWTCVFRRGNLIEFFDSYGGFPDTQLEWIDDHFREISGQSYPLLTWLLYHSPYDLSYNEHKFQKKGDDIATCGRWCSLRLAMKDMPLEEFYDAFHGRRSDDVVSILTSMI